jgi:predicted metalloprotease with PDZ domain
MIRYTIRAANPHRHFIEILASIPTEGKEVLQVQIPAWRPGRYELANYAQNIQSWKVEDENGQALHSRKLSKDSWEISCKGIGTVLVKYNYYAYQLDAGASYFDENQLYVNPVNCLIYLQERIEYPCQLTLEGLRDDYQIASSIQFASEDNGIHAATLRNYHYLADSPFIASASLQHFFYQVGEYTFHIWMQGNCRPDKEKITEDFSDFSRAQIEMFGELPVKEYHFLFQLPDHKFYHGVEHLDSTVIALGPGYRLMQEEIYREFLGISSHELFHSWNIKSIRPVEMFPYDYSRENYSNLGYVAEGVTTYYGDLMLLRSGAYDWSTFSLEKSKFMQRHFHNYGRMFQSLTEASFDSWLDGYKPGVPDRKISFYVKGMLVAFILDIRMRRDTSNAESLDSVMRELYYEFAKKDRGFSEEDYFHIVEEKTGKPYRDFFERYVWGLEPLEEALADAMSYIGCRLITTPAKFYFEDSSGFRIKEENGKSIIGQVAPGSPADLAGLSLNDEILAVNGMQVEKSLDELMRFAGDQDSGEIIMTVFRSKQLLEFSLAASEDHYFPDYFIVKSPDADEEKKWNFEAWAGIAF